MALDIQSAPWHFGNVQTATRQPTGMKTMAKPSTHSGHCQICGRRHKLPGGMLAKHGYAVKNRGQGGYFTGVCFGSDRLPYELDHNALDLDIERAKDYLANIPARIEALLASDSTTVTLMLSRGHAYRDQPVTGTIVETGKEFFQDMFKLVAQDGSEWKVRNNSHRTKTALDFCKQHRAGIANNLENEARMMQHHIEAQQKRRADWNPNQPLMPHREAVA